MEESSNAGNGSGDMRQIIKESRKDMLDAQKKQIEDFIQANSIAVEKQILIQKEISKKVPRFNGDPYPARIPKPSENQVKTTDTKFQNVQTSAIEPLGYEKLIPKYTHWTTIKRNYRVT